MPAPVIDPGDGGRYAPEIDPANFVDVVDNPYFPLPAGAGGSTTLSPKGRPST